MPLRVIKSNYLALAGLTCCACVYSRDGVINTILTEVLE